MLDGVNIKVNTLKISVDNLKQELCKNGGLRVTLYKHTKTRFLVHRLVAEAFIPNQNNNNYRNNRRNKNKKK